MISAYVDMLVDLESQIELFKALNLDKFVLRDFNHLNVYDLSEEAIDEVETLFKLNKIRPLYLDITKTYDVYGILDVERLIYLAKRFKTKDILIKVPTIKDFNIEKDIFIEQIQLLLAGVKKDKLNLTFNLSYDVDSAYIAYLIKEIKEIKFSFNPGLCYEKEKSVTSYYRLIKNNLSHVILFDLNENKKPSLIGYGKATILEHLDKLKRDNFKGSYILDTNLLEYVEERQTIYKRKFKIPFLKKGRNQNKKAYESIENRLGLAQTDEISFDKLYESQVSLVKRYLK
ncbi:MAG: hypothetical protein RBQ63_01415 [Acholeplasmatales bacterium]|nr:hypothetical protein [Acholeplasmatales bacterium]